MKQLYVAAAVGVAALVSGSPVQASEAISHAPIEAGIAPEASTDMSSQRRRYRVVRRYYAPRYSSYAYQPYYYSAPRYYAPSYYAPRYYGGPAISFGFGFGGPRYYGW